jgi:hypothetical protein
LIQKYSKPSQRTAAVIRWGIYENDFKRSGGTMTTEPNPSNEPAMHSRTITVVSIIVLCVFAFCLGIVFPFVLAFQLIAGWVFYLGRILPTLTISVEHIFWFLSALIMFMVGLHLECRYYYLRTETTQSKWRKHWTLSLVPILLTLVMSGICVISITHQTWWMVTGEDKVLIYRRGMMAARRSQSRNNQKQIGLAMHNYHDDVRQLPIGGTFSSGQPHHSWVTRLLPYLDQAPLYNKIDFHQPWTAKTNREHFQSDLHIIQNPDMKSDYDNGKNSKEAFQGYQPSHYAANSRVLNVNSTMKLHQIKDGTSNTILAGEIKFQIKPWGDPTNFCDPARGINKSPHGFGGPFKGGANFLLGDGSVRFLSEDIDPAVLKALSTPNGGEPVGDY